MKLVQLIKVMLVSLDVRCLANKVIAFCGVIRCLRFIHMHCYSTINMYIYLQRQTKLDTKSSVKSGELIQQMSRIHNNFRQSTMTKKRKRQSNIPQAFYLCYKKYWLTKNTFNELSKGAITSQCFCKFLLYNLIFCIHIQCVY